MNNTQTTSAKIGHRWVSITEVLLIVSSLGTSVAAVILQQSLLATLASVPLSLAVGLNSWEKNRLSQAYQESQASIIRLEQQLEAWQSSNTILNLIEAESHHESSIEEISKYLQVLQNKIYWLDQNIQHRQPIAFKNIVSRKDIKELEGEIKEVDSRIDNFRIPDIKQRMCQIEREIHSLHFKIKNDSIANQENVETRIHNAMAELRSQYTILARRVEEIQVEIKNIPAKQPKYFNQTNSKTAQDRRL
ncbi:hypothetical protein [Microseira wollei]|uniref:Chromosome partition protein Smc n=1 Tax=Microseira wollei NIES-4236 TaxID=2530354 RepID=A0AAV3XSI6_9CYAN|nr:hypothetical protein [Microseira wollei]GET44024.1 hypothetical protein MiSe_88500 [Microseira wollei NIES-4236]